MSQTDALIEALVRTLQYQERVAAERERKRFQRKIRRASSSPEPVGEQTEGAVTA